MRFGNRPDYAALHPGYEFDRSVGHVPNPVQRRRYQRGDSRHESLNGPEDRSGPSRKRGSLVPADVDVSAIERPMRLLVPAGLGEPAAPIHSITSSARASSVGGI